MDGLGCLAKSEVGEKFLPLSFGIGGEAVGGSTRGVNLVFDKIEVTTGEVIVRRWDLTGCAELGCEACWVLFPGGEVEVDDEDGAIAEGARDEEYGENVPCYLGVYGEGAREMGADEVGRDEGDYTCCTITFV